MANNEEFLKAYTELEQAVRIIGVDSVLQYEDKILDPDTKEKIKLGRIIRNYLRHHNDGDDLVSVNKGLTDVFIKETLKVYLDNKPAKDVMQKVPGVVLPVPVKNLAKIFKTYSVRRIAVLNKDKTVKGYITAGVLLNAVANDKESIERGVITDNIKLLTDVKAYRDLQPNTYFVVNKKMQYVGSIEVR